MYRYIGEGRYFHGIPARDLTQDEWDSLSPEMQQLALERRLYRPAHGGEILVETGAELVEVLAKFDPKKKPEGKG